MEKNKGDNMIVIKTEDMNQKINKLQKAIDDLELDLLNFYKELKESSDFWRDQKSMIFYNNVENRKINEEQFILELKEYQNILKNTESKYSMYGNIIKYDSDKRNIEAIDEAINILYKIIEKFSYLNTNYLDNEKIFLDEQKKYIIEESERLIQYRKELKEVYDNFDRVEKETNSNLSNYNLSIIDNEQIENLTIL